MNRRQLRLHHRRPCYQAFVIVHLVKESTESGKVRVQHCIDILLKVEESALMLRFKKELIPAMLGAVVIQQAGTQPYATALIIIRFKLCILVKRGWDDYDKILILAIIDQVFQF